MVILTGAGQQASRPAVTFTEWSNRPPRNWPPVVRFAVEPPWHLATFSKPIIGAIDGLAYGAGAQLTSNVSYAHRLRTRRVPSFPRRKIWPGQFDLVIASGRGHAQGQGAALHRTAGSKRRKPSESACSTNSYPALSCARPRSRWASLSAKTTPAWCKASNAAARGHRHGLARMLRQRAKRAQDLSQSQLAAGGFQRLSGSQRNPLKRSCLFHFLYKPAMKPL